ncbi:MAG: NAD(P)/FAD-dependent oxidoreductase [Terracoccus sp.]
MIEHLDVLVVGAGLSGVGAAYRLQTMCPGLSYAVLEAREAIGGTWDLFRYPGVRSDSDMATLGYPFEPWDGRDAIADGDEIRSYIGHTAAKFGIDQRIRFGHSVIAADWSSEQARWTVTVERDGVRKRLTCGFLYLCCGYYDYERGHSPEFAGSDEFDGPVVHPQFWPDDLDVSGRKVVVIGSGATAVTLVPALEARGADVTMLQRSATWVTSLPRRDRGSDLARAVLPRAAAARLVRYRTIATTSAFYQLTRRRPKIARAMLTKGAERGIGSAEVVREHFQPVYDPWDQRLCLVPDGDLFEALRGGRARVVTDTIDRFTPSGIRLASGCDLAADVIVTATGLTLKFAGGIAISVDGQAQESGKLVTYRGAMFGGVPNLAACVGYVNASWTLRADLTSRYVCRLLNLMQQRGWRSATPQTPDGLSGRSLLPLTSGYVRRSEGVLPRQGDAAPWLMRQNYLLDQHDLRRADLTEAMAFTS